MNPFLLIAIATGIYALLSSEKEVKSNDAFRETGNARSGGSGAGKQHSTAKHNRSGGLKAEKSKKKGGEKSDVQRGDVESNPDNGRDGVRGARNRTATDSDAESVTETETK